MFCFIGKEKRLAAVSEFALAIRDRIMSQINQHLTDMKEVLRAQVTQAIMEELTMQEIAVIDNTPDGQHRLNNIKRKITGRVDSIVTQQAVAAMDRISKIQTVDKPNTIKRKK